MEKLQAPVKNNFVSLKLGATTEKALLRTRQIKNVATVAMLMMAEAHVLEGDNLSVLQEIWQEANLAEHFMLLKV